MVGLGDWLGSSLRSRKKEPSDYGISIDWLLTSPAAWPAGECPGPGFVAGSNHSYTRRNPCDMAGSMKPIPPQALMRRMWMLCVQGELVRQRW